MGNQCVKDYHSISCDSFTEGDKPNKKVNGQSETSFILTFPSLSNVRYTAAALIVVIMLLCTTLFSVEFIQSALHENDELGAIGLGSNYLAAVTAYLVLPSLLISKFGYKWSMVFCCLGYIPYAIINAFENISVIVVGNIVSGLTRAPVKVAISALYSQLCIWYAQLNYESEVAVLNCLMGLYYMATNSGKLFGALLLCFVITSSHVNNTNTDMKDILQCVNNENSFFVNDTVIQTADKTQVYILSASWSVLVMLAIIVLLLMPNLKSDVSCYENTSPVKLIMESAGYILNSPSLILLTPIILFSGMSMTFFIADFTKSFVGCLHGIDKIGQVILLYGIFNTFSGVIIGYFVKYVGLTVALTCAFLTNLSAILILLLWDPNTKDMYILYLTAALAGLSDSGLKTQIMALYGCIFQDRKDAAFTHLHFCEGVGNATVFFFSAYIATVIKLYILLFLLFIGSLGYYIVAYKKGKQLQK